MRTITLLGVWIYMMLAVAAEVLVFYTIGSSSYAMLATVVSILAGSQALAVVVFFMHLKDESSSLRLFSIIPVMMLAALLIAMLATLG